MNEKNPQFVEAKILALALAMVMAFGLTATNVFAATGDPSITITDKNPEGTVSTTYNYYEILRASIDGDAVSYYLNDNTDDTLRNLLNAVTVDGQDLFTFTQTADGTKWIAKINKKADDSAYTDSDGAAIAAALNTTAIKNAAVNKGNFSQTDTGTVTATVPEKGYYLVESSLGSALVLQTLRDVSIATKNDYITDTKTASKTNMEVGDIVEYTITVNLPATTKVDDIVTVHDTLDANLAILKQDETIATDAADYYITAKIGTDGAAVTLEDGTKNVATETFAKKFTVTQAMITAGSVTLTYKAELLSTAATDTGYVNTEFSNTSAYETAPKQVKVYTFDINVDKNFAGIGSADADNYEATFELRVGSATGTAIQFASDSTGYVKADSNDTTKSATLTVRGGAAINIRGLAAGTYYLVETSTATGFNMLTEPVIVTITDTTTVTQPNITPSHTVSYKLGESGTSATGTVEVENQSGAILPSTGGMGTTIFYAIGSILVVGAGVLLISKKRMFN